MGMDYKELLMMSNSDTMNDGKFTHLDSIRKQKIMAVYRLVKEMNAGRGNFVIRK